MTPAMTKEQVVALAKANNNNLSMLNASGADLSGINLQHANLDEANMGSSIGYTPAW